MEINGSDLKFALSYLTALTVLWKVSAWVTRKQILIETFFADLRDFMMITSSSIQRIETNHLVHQQQSLDAIQSALAPNNGYIEISASENQPEENSDAV